MELVTPWHLLIAFALAGIEAAGLWFLFDRLHSRMVKSLDDRHETDSRIILELTARIQSPGTASLLTRQKAEAESRVMADVPKEKLAEAVAERDARDLMTAQPWRNDVRFRPYQIDVGAGEGGSTRVQWIEDGMPVFDDKTDTEMTLFYHSLARKS